MTTRFTVVPSLAVAWLVASAPPTHAGDFDRLVRRIESHYAIRSEAPPGGWLARLIVGIARPEGVLDVNIATLSGADAERLAARDDLAETVGRSLGTEWHRIVHVRSQRDGTTVSIHGRYAGGKYSLMIVSLDPDEGSIVGVDLRPERFLEWIVDPLNARRRSPA